MFDPSPLSSILKHNSKTKIITNIYIFFFFLLSFFFLQKNTGSDKVNCFSFQKTQENHGLLYKQHFQGFSISSMFFLSILKCWLLNSDLNSKFKECDRTLHDCFTSISDVKWWIIYGCIFLVLEFHQRESLAFWADTAKNQILSDNKSNKYKIANN